MPLTRSATITFRLDAEQKAKLTKLARKEGRAVGELMRSLAEARVDEEERRAWEAEARRQAQAIAGRAADLATDDARTMDWIEAVSEDVDWDR